MTPNQPQPAPPLAPIGSTFEMMGFLFECVGHDVDNRGNTVERPGKCLGRAPKQSKRSGHGMVATPATTTVRASNVQPAPPLSSATQPTAPRRQKARRFKATPRGGYRGYQRFQKKPPPLVIHQESWSTANWVALIAVITLIVAGIWLSNVGNEQAKWRSIEAAANAVKGR